MFKERGDKHWQRLNLDFDSKQDIKKNMEKTKNENDTKEKIITQLESNYRKDIEKIIIKKDFEKLVVFLDDNKYFNKFITEDMFKTKH